jgi:endoglucanase
MKITKLTQSWLVITMLLILLITLSGCTQAAVALVEKARSAKLAEVDAFALNQQLGRGVNLGNALEAPREGEWGLHLEAEHFALIAEAGFDAVRVPIKWSAHAQETAPYTIDPAFLARIDWVVEQARINGLAVVLNIHHYDEMNQDPDAYQARFLALWAQIADHYQAQPATVVFELLNEPNSNLLVYKWNDILNATITTIRQTNPTRTLIVGPTDWNSIHSLSNLELPVADRHLIVTFHYYEPFHFTHQGAEWVTGSGAWAGTTWTGSKGEQQSITTAFNRAAAWAQQQNRPLYLGEFGAYSKADIDSRAAWTAFVARQAEEHNISWAYWEFGAGFGVYDRGRAEWNEKLLAALLAAK